MQQKLFPIELNEKLYLALEQYKIKYALQTIEDAIWDLLNQDSKSTEEFWDPNIPDFIKDKISHIPNLNTREKIILGLRFGLDGQKPHTLESIGKSLGLTRERVRQLINNILEQSYNYATIIPSSSLHNPFNGEKNIVQEVEKILIFKNSVLRVVANEFLISENNIISNFEALGIASYLMKDVIGLSVKTLSELFVVPSSEIIQSYDKLKEKINYDPDLFEKVKRVINNLNATFKEVAYKELNPNLAKIKRELLDATLEINKTDRNALFGDSLDLTLLSTRAKNALKRNKIFFEKDLIILTRDNLLNMPWLGRKTVEEISEFIKNKSSH